MKRKLHRIVAFALALIMTFSGMGLTFTTLAGNTTNSELRNSGWDYGFTANLGSADVSYLNDAFDVYQFANPLTDSATQATLGPVEPSSENSASIYNETKTHFTTMNIGTTAKGGLRPTSVPSSGFSVLTYTKEEMLNFEAEYEIYGNNSQEFGIMFGTDKGKFAVSLDGNNANDAGVFLATREDGKDLFVAGKFDNTNAKVEGATPKITQNVSSKWFPHFRDVNNVRVQAMFTGLQAVQATVTESSPTQTFHVKVQDGVLTVYEKSAPNVVFSTQLTDEYKGGYVSLVASSSGNGAFKSFKIKSLDWDYKFKADLGSSDVSYLNEAFDVYQFANPLTDNATQATLGPVEPSSENSASIYNETKSHFTTMNIGTTARGGLRPTSVPSSGFSVLTYTKEELFNFEAEYEIYGNNSQEFGIMFGVEKGKFAVSLDGNNTNDSGVFLATREDGKDLFVAGKFDNTNAKVEGASPTITKNVSSKWFPHFKDVNNVRVQAMFTGLQAVQATVTDSSPTQTFHVKVQDGVLTVYEKSAPNVVFSTQLTDDYKGGFISLVASSAGNGAFKSFKIKKLSGSVPVVDPMDAVAEQFDAYYLADASQSKQLASVDIRDKWTKNGEFLVAKKENTGNDTKNVDVLTFKSQSYKDFEVSFTYQQTYQRIGIALGTEKGVYPISQYGDVTVAEGGVMFYLEAEGTATAIGDFVNGYTNSKKVMRRLTGLGLDNFTDVNGNASSHVNNKTEHTIKIVVKDKDLYVYVDSYANPIMYLALPETYNGGYVSIFSAANKNFGIKDYKISEEIKTALPEKETGGNVYAVDFTKLHGIQELNNDFKAYTLDSTENPMVETTPSEAFVISGKGIRRNASSNGDDWGGFNILTYTGKEYKNFELEMVFAQSFKRYGVMFGGELGEFAVSGNFEESRGTHGVAFAYTETEGHRNVRGELAAGMTTVHRYTLRKDDSLIPGFDNLGSIENNVNNEVLHTLKIRVVDGYMTMIVDGNEDSRMTTLIDGYEGGYISLVTNGSVDTKGTFNYLKITELGDDAVLGTETPTLKDGFQLLDKVEEEFDAYYLEDATKSTKMEQVDLVENWWFNAQGFIARDEGKNGSEYKDVDVLTYKKQKYTDFQVEFEVQQTFNRTGIILGTEKGEFPLASNEGILKANKGIMLFVEAEGVPNAMGDFTNGYTNINEVRRRLTNLNLSGFVDEDGVAKTNVENGVAHKVTIVVKDKNLYMFIDDSNECALYLTLPEDYAGGYVSLFSSTTRKFGIDKFEISETITKTIPSKEKLVTKTGNEVNIDFDAMIPDATGLSTYYLNKLDDKGTVQKTNLTDYWMIANGKLNRQSDRNAGSDVSDVAVLTYTEKQYTNFVATFEYQQSYGRLMFLFGGQNGKYPLYEKEGHFENGGVILYPEADLGSGAGICALGNVKIATEGYRPLYRELSYAPGYYKKDMKMGIKRTMTVAVINKHCSVYIEGFGLVASFDLNDNYKGGYISLASAQTEYQGFTYLNIREITNTSVIKGVAQNKDITVKTGTALKDISLPKTVKVIGANGKTTSVPVTWTDNGYDGTKQGEYQFVGTLVGVNNPGMLTSSITVRVRDKVTKNSGATKKWTFDTNSDLLDFKSFFVEDAKKGKTVESDYPSWFVRNGVLQKDRNRTNNGSISKNVFILTYTGQKYKNFELEVDFSQQYVRDMVMFGSKTLGQYLNYAEPKSPDNPICVYVEYEGIRNATGNVVNTNYYTRLDEDMPVSREDFAENDSYYSEKDREGNLGDAHHLKLRVVGDTFTIWLDDQKTIYSGKLGESYEGGYISLVSTAKTGWFDNLSITELDDKGNPVADAQEATANGTLDIDYELVKDDEKAVAAFEFAPWMILPILTVVSVMAVVVIIMAARKQSKKKKEGKS